MKKILSLLLVACMFLSFMLVLCSCKKNEQPKEELKTIYLPVKAVLNSAKGEYSIVAELGENNLYSKITAMGLGNLHSTTEMVYDSNCNAIKSTYTDFDGDVVVNENTYDSQGRVVKTVVIFNNGESTAIYESKYDEHGNVVELLLTTSDDSWSKEEYTYDSKGNMTKIIITYDDGSSSEVNYTYTYDSHGNLSEKTAIYDYLTCHYSYTYDSNGNAIKVVYTETYTYNNQTEETTFDITYDSNGNIIKIVSTNNSNEVNTYIFEYKKVTVPQNVKIDTNVEVESWYSRLNSMEPIVVEVVTP